MIEYHCKKCGADLSDATPEITVERDENGPQRLFRTVPELCDACREKRLWKRVERLKEDKRD
jgi:DNA-directed RNA polymerase subunit RPC12/RpoP